jgi:hypothetical protein
VKATDFYGLPFNNSNQVYFQGFYRLNEHWQFGTTQSLDTDDNQLSEQSYTVYRDLSAWQLGVTYEERQNHDRGSEDLIYFTLTLKAFPAAGLKFAE